MALVQVKFTEITAASASIDLTLDTPPTPGNTLIAFFGCDTAVTASSIGTAEDSLAVCDDGVTTAYLWDSGNSTAEQVWSKSNITGGGSGKVVATIGTSVGYRSFGVFEISGDGGMVLAEIAKALTAPPGPADPGTLTPTKDNSFIACAVLCDQNPTTGSAFNQAWNWSTTAYNEGEYQQQTTATQVDTFWGGTISATATSIAVLFEPVGSVSSPSGTNVSLGQGNVSVLIRNDGNTPFIIA